jgi:hypothetical protein
MDAIIGLIIDLVQIIFELFFELIHFICRKLGYSENTIRKINRWLVIPFLIIMIPLFWLIHYV